MKEAIRELAATVILEAAYTTDEKACAKYDVTTKTLSRWRKAMCEDEELRKLIAVKQKYVNERWADEFPVMFREAAKTLTSCFEEIRNDKAAKKNPMLIQSVAGAVKLCADVFLTSKIIDARLTPPNRPQDGLFGQDAPEGAEDRPN
jgi:DNA replicative helicase MCM subunit Mcm2 (Cdc46/Mcm family)